MVISLDEVENASIDPPDEERIKVIQHRLNGLQGHPRIDIDAHVLQYSLELHPNTALGQMFDCSTRTIQCCSLELGLAQPCPPVAVYHNGDNGSRTVEYTSYTPAMANLTDDQLDRFLINILEIFPSFGRQMIAAQFQVYGYRVSRKRIHDSYLRVVGPPPEFGRCCIEHRVYKVGGPNALSHYDGWHGKCHSLVIL